MKLNRFFLTMLSLILLAIFVVAASDSIGDTLGGDKFKKILYTGDELRSPNGRYQLVMQTDCNLVFYGPDRKAIWASNTQNAGKLCVMNLVGGDYITSRNEVLIQNYLQQTVWSIRGNGYCGLTVKNNGHLTFNCRAYVHGIGDPQKKSSAIAALSAEI